MEYRIRKNVEGTFEVIQFEPVVVGTFQNRGMAEKVVVLLHKDITEASAPESCSPEPPATLTPVVQALSPNVEPLKFKSPTKRRPNPTLPKPPTLGDVAAMQSDTEWTEVDLNAAFARLASGEKLRAVADSFGKDWLKLRSKWAKLKRSYCLDQPKPAPKPQLPVLRGDAQTPLAKVTTAIEDVKNRATCTLCGRSFNITPDAIDICGRCQNAT